MYLQDTGALLRFSTGDDDTDVFTSQFCYSCRALWKTCPCPRWDEHLFAEPGVDPPDVARYPIRGGVDPQREVNTPQTRKPLNEPWLFRTRTDPSQVSATSSVSQSSPPPPNSSLRRHVSLGHPPRRKGSIDESGRSHPNRIAVPQAGCSKPLPLPPRRDRSSAPPTFPDRHGVVARGLDAQQRRKGRRKPPPTIDDEPPVSPATEKKIEGKRLDALDQQIDNLLHTVQNYGCHHDWHLEKGLNGCDGCGVHGLVMSVSGSRSVLLLGF